MGQDGRSAEDIIQSDAAVLARLHVTIDALAKRMSRITEAAEAGLGTWVAIDDKRRAMALGAKGFLVCPWGHRGQYRKTVTIVELIGWGRSTRWSDLSVHMIAEHGFFQGRGSTFRIEPKELIEIIF